MGMEYTPLQQAAIDRIRFFEDELGKRGLKVRLSFEQKFYIPQKSTMQYNLVGSQMRKNFKTYLSYGQNENDRKFEMRFGSDHNCAHSAVDIADDITKFRNEGAAVILKDGKELEFAAIIPMERFLFRDRDITLGLHANSSVYDASGNDLCDNGGFFRAKGERLLNLIYRAGLGYIQNEDTLKRLGSWSHAAREIGMTTHDYAKIGKNRGYTVLERRNLNHYGEKYYPDHYHENRIASANADPYVIAALELAAIYDLVTQRDELKDKHITMEYVHEVWPHHPGPIGHALDHTIEKDMGAWGDRFRKHGELRELLGAPLYDGILQEYDKQRGER
jgi:hypothetical protein